MANKLCFRFVLCAGLIIGGAGSFLTPSLAFAQDRGPRDGDWRERFRNRGEGDRGRDSRGGEGGRGDWRSGGGGGDWRDRSRGDGDRHESDKDKHKDSKSGDSKPTTTTSSTSSDTKSDPAAELAKTKAWATSIVKDKDKDKNGWLNGDEIKELSSGAAKADTNSDGAITVDELVANATKPSSTAAAAPAAGSSGDSGHHRDGDKKPGSRVLYGSVGGPAGSTKEGEKQRRTYRFTPAPQKLPSGLPDWFNSKDANHDGQVSMSEYGKSWTERSVADFLKFDSNNDGVITPKEATKAPSGG